MIFAEMPLVVKGLATKLSRIINGLEEECLPRTRRFTVLVGQLAELLRVSPPHAGVHLAGMDRLAARYSVSPARGGSPG